MLMIILLWSTTASPIAAALLECRVYAYGSPSVLVDNRQWFGAKFFDSLCSTLDSVMPRITAFHPQIDEQTRWFNKKIAQRLRRCVADHETDRDYT